MYRNSIGILALIIRIYQYQVQVRVTWYEDYKRRTRPSCRRSPRALGRTGRAANGRAWIASVLARFGTAFPIRRMMAPTAPCRPPGRNSGGRRSSVSLPVAVFLSLMLSCPLAARAYPRLLGGCGQPTRGGQVGPHGSVVVGAIVAIELRDPGSALTTQFSPGERHSVTVETRGNNCIYLLASAGVLIDSRGSTSESCGGRRLYLGESVSSLSFPVALGSRSV